PCARGWVSPACRSEHIYSMADQVGCQRRQLIVIASCPAVLYTDILAFAVTLRGQTFAPCSNHVCGILRRPGVEEPDYRHRWLLCARRERPRRRRAAEERDELAALHSITSSARASSVGGTSRPSALAVVRSMTRSNFVEARRMRVCYPSRPSARMVSCTFGLA